LIFAVLGVFCLAGMLLYNRFFSEDTPETNRRAWKVMLGIYLVIAAAGIYFFIYSVFLSPQIQWKTFVQSLIMLAFGGGGMAISLRMRR
jgi:drug/metabolite transporter (DMT)-like permease